MRKLLIIILISVCYVGAQSKNVQQFVENWPAGYDTTGMRWVVYDCDSAVGKWLTHDTIGSYTNVFPASQRVMWNANCGNFAGSIWQPGDSVIGFGCWDSAYATDPVAYGNNPNHVGFYWLFSDTLTTQEPQEWQPHDTLRVIPQPIAYLQSSTSDPDSIVIKIPNPIETRRLDQNIYDVLGYEIYAAQNIGTPNNLNIFVAYVSCQGGIGDTTMYKDIESNYLCETIYYAYKMVIRPDTTASEQQHRGHTSAYFSMNSDPVSLQWSGTAPGSMTYYLSMNSDPLIISYVGSEETQEMLIPHSPSFTVSPNPFQTATTIEYKLGCRQNTTGHGVPTIRIFDATGRLVRNLIIPTPCSLLPTTISWDGTDNKTLPLPAGIYFCYIQIAGIRSSAKIIKLE